MAFQVVSFPRISPPNPCIHLFSLHKCHMSRGSHSLFDRRLIFGGKYRSYSSSLCSFLHSPITSSLLGQYTFIDIIFSNIHSLYYPSMRNTIFHTHTKPHNKWRTSEIFTHVSHEVPIGRPQLLRQLWQDTPRLFLI